LKTTINVNGEARSLDLDPRTTLLDALREHLKLTGSKKGCDHGQCGACTVHINGAAARACVTPVGMVADAKITTIEGLSTDGSHPVQQAWLTEQVPQCGYCQSGQIMAAVALLASKPAPTDADIDQAMDNICRCGTYERIRLGIIQLASLGGLEQKAGISIEIFPSRNWLACYLD
jgi:aerobic-type carbon monoxide dehydrogenase small subunit (CoxS/CutS family)